MAKNENCVVARELKERSDSEIRSLLGIKQEELYKAKFKHSLNQLKETHTLKSLKKDIACLTTILRAREIENMKEQA